LDRPTTSLRQPERPEERICRTVVDSTKQICGWPLSREESWSVRTMQDPCEAGQRAEGASPPAGFLSMPRNREECHPRQSATSVQTTLERLKSPACLNLLLLLLLLLMMMMMILLLLLLLLMVMTMTETKICPAPTAHPELMSFP